MAKKKNNLKHKYKILITSHNREIKYVDGFTDIKDAYTLFNKMKKANEEVKFPVKYVNKKKILPAKYEIVMLERNDDEEALLPNEYGKNTVHVITNNDNWKMMDKCPYLKEETFWYYGYHPSYSRKTVDFIINNIRKDEYKEFLLFKNKLIIRYDNDIDLITCKCREDSYRLMNYIMKIIKPSSKTVYYYNLNETYQNTVKNLIHKKTGWDFRKILRHSTRP